MIQYKFFLCFFFLLFGIVSYGQDGPGGVGNTSGNSNLQLWLKASDLLMDHSDGDPVLEWVDKSGAANNVSTNITSAPLFRESLDSNYSSVEFLGNQYLQTEGISNSFSNPESTIFVLKEGGNFFGTIISIANTGWISEMVLFNDEQYHHSSSGNFTKLSQQCLEEIPEEEYAILCGVFGQTPEDIKYLVNGVESTNTLYLAGSPSDYAVIDRKVTIGQRAQFVSQEYLQGKILEIIVYNTKLSDVEIERVEEYLNCGNEALPMTACYDLSAEACDINSSLLPSLLQKNISIGPNPTTNFLYLNMEEQSNLKHLDYTIYNTYGQAVLSGQTMTTKKEINVNHFAKGVYFLKLELEDEFYTLKFVKD